LGNSQIYVRPSIKKIIYSYNINNIYIYIYNLIIKAAVEEALDDKNVASDFYETLNDEAANLLEDAERRAEANDRKTVQPRDL